MIHVAIYKNALSKLYFQVIVTISIEFHSVYLSDPCALVSYWPCGCLLIALQINTYIVTSNILHATNTIAMSPCHIL